MQRFAQYIRALDEGSTLQRVARRLLPSLGTRELERLQTSRKWAAVRRAQEKKLRKWEAAKAARKDTP